MCPPSLRKSVCTPIILLAVVLATAPSFAPTSPALAQPPAAAPRIHATMFHHVIAWTADPGDGFEVTLRDAAGTEKGYLWAGADAEGRVREKLTARHNDFNYQRIQPGDRLVIARFAGAELLDLEIPDAGADVSDDGRRIVGQAPAGTRLVLVLEPRGSAAPFTAELVAGADGGFSLDLPDEVVLQPGEGGKLSFTHSDGHVFDIQIARRRVEIQVGSTRAEGRATLQTPVSVRRRVDFGDRLALRSLGRQIPRPDGPPTDGRATYSDDARFRIGAGTVVTFSQQGGPLGRADNVVRTMPDLAIHVDGPRRISGHGPPGAALELDVVPAEPASEPAPAPTRFGVVADAQGAFVLPLPAPLSLAAGWRAVLRQDLGDGIFARAEVALPRFRLSVHAARLDTRVAPFQTLTVTLLARDGSLRAREVARADEAGEVELHLDNGEMHPRSGWDVLVPFEPGDTVEIDLGSGDPARLVVPTLSAGTDPDAEVIRGRAPPGASLTAEVFAGANVIQQRVTADAAGEYVVELGGAVDFEPGVQSIVTWTDPRGHEFYVLTAPLRLAVTPGRTYLEFVPNIGYPITTTLLTAEGVVAGRGGEVLREIGDPREALVSLDEYEAVIWFEDRFEAGLRYRPGDRVEVQSGGDVARLTVLPLDGRMHVEDDLVIGRTEPGARLQVDSAVYEATNVTALLTADANGYFQHSFRGSADLRYNSSVLVTVFAGRHRVRYGINGPGLLLDFSAARLAGSVEPNVDLTARLGPASAPRAGAAARAGGDAEFNVILRDPAGEPVEPRAGDPLAILAPAAELTREILWTLPRLTLAVDPDTGVTRGTAEPDALVQATIDEAVGYPGVRDRLGLLEDREFPRIAPDGAWSVTEIWPRLAGTRVQARMTLPSGHIALRSVTHPILSVQHGGSAVCGIGHPHSRVVISLHDAAGREIARAAGRADAEGFFDLRLADTAGRAVRTAQGMRASADIGGVAAELALGPLEVEFDPATGQISARVLPKAVFEVYFPARTCLAGDDGEVWRELTGGVRHSGDAVVRAGDDGMWSRVLPWDQKYLATGIDAATYSPDGHRTYRAVHLPLSGLAYVGTDRLVGRSAPGASVQVLLSAPDGTLRYEANVTADDRGHFELRLGGGSDPSVRLNPNDRVDLVAGADRAALTVEPLSFDYSPEVGIQGHAPPDRGLRLGLAFRHDTPDYFDYFDLRSDTAGRFALLASDLSPRGPWTFTDVSAIDVALPQAGGHATVAQWRAGEREWRVLLPWVARE